MEKRYQVFISSTYLDLGKVRQKAISSMLRIECFPVGMEYFSAANIEQFEYIKKEIEQSDYMVCISAGKYGSLHPATGVSFTEMEYDYAMHLGKPIIRLLHKDPEVLLPGSALENTDEGRESLKRFRAKLSNSHMVAFWSDANELGSELILGLHYLKRQYSECGWVRYQAAFRDQNTN